MGSGVLWGWPQELLAVFVIRDSWQNLYLKARRILILVGAASTPGTTAPDLPSPFFRFSM